MQVQFTIGNGINQWHKSDRLHPLGGYVPTISSPLIQFDPLAAPQVKTASTEDTGAYPLRWHGRSYTWPLALCYCATPTLTPIALLQHLPLPSTHPYVPFIHVAFMAFTSTYFSVSLAVLLHSLWCSGITHTAFLWKHQS